ncbi:hypothetical protein [Xanthomarina sp. F2636L]|uniref:hypothetical protein n=1 Tax=Xanthomarina sp. F2636L TaxID=2996018 RepID=UPI00225E3E9E|nr:hypothetical protein [Xanthomarina sp. F2636L]MCX7550721.1 hypothetical protein [Xanthomarina sp. F2636L]
MKNKLKSIFLLALSAGVLATSCSEDDHTGASMINYSSPTVTLSTASTSVVVDESMIDPDDEGLGYEIEVTASIPEPVFADIHIPLVQVGGTAGSSDFSGGTIVITSGHTSATANVTIWRECESGVEGEETLTISYGDNIANAKMAPFSMDITIIDWVNDALEISVGWEGTYTFTDQAGTEVEIDFCGLDIDTVLFDDMGNALGYISGTSDCTEVDVISGLADGTYYIVADVFENPFEDYYVNDDDDIVDVPIVLTTSYSQCGFPDTTGSFVTEGLTSNISNPVSDPHLVGEVAIAIATVEVTGGYNYVVTPL